MSHSPSPAISVIVPVYNGERWLGTCLDSLTGQTGVDVEIIVVDDASSDASRAIADQRAMQHARIIIIHNTDNLGPYQSRLRGFAASRGRYIAVCDADDLMPAGALKVLLDCAEKHDADIVHGRARALVDGGPGARLHVCEPFAVSACSASATAMLRNLRGWNLWGKLYRRELWERALARLPHGLDLRVAEDLVLSVALALEGGAYAEVRKTVYLYRLPASGYFADPSRAEGRARDHLQALGLMREFTVGPGASTELPALVERLGRHFAAAILRNLPEDNTETKQAIRAMVCTAMPGDASHAPSPSSRDTGVAGRLVRSACGGIQHLRYGGTRECAIAMHRFLAAAKKRGWRAVLGEIDGL